MVSVAVLIPVRGGRAAVGAAETVCEGVDAAGGPDACRVLLVGDGTQSAAASLADAGFGDVAMQCGESGSFAPGAWADALAGMVADDELVLLPASTDGRDLAPRLAMSTGRALIPGAMAVNAERAVVPRASGRALVAYTLTGPVVATLQPGVRHALREPVGERRTPETIPGFAVTSGWADARVLEVLQARAATMDLSEAPFILGAGAGLGSRESVEDLDAVAGCLDASLGATRVVTDDGWADHERQIGTTGVVVDPSVYVAFGISGAVQHTSGLGAPDHVISVNTDAHCPMMHLADVAIVADAPAVVTELRRLLNAPDDPVAEGGNRT